MKISTRQHCAAIRHGLGALATFVACAAQAARVEPSNLPPGFCDVAVTTDLTVTTDQAFDTDTACDSVVTQTGGPALCVVRFRNITVQSSGTVRAAGSRALVLTASQDFVVHGRVDMNGIAVAAGAAPSPGAVGAGGAGHASNGSSGGASGNATGLAGGPAIGNPALVPLTSGARGGRGGANGAGGAGGGAIQLVACGDFLLEATGTIEANGHGGAGGAGGGVQADGSGGAGGGSGGGILVEAETVGLLGRVVANGGGGGGGGSGGTFSSGGAGGLGQNGGLTTTRALGGPGGNTAPTGGDGGAGAALMPSSGALAGDPGSSSDGGGGGGGGSAGRIRINTCTGLANTATVVSPAPSTGSSCPNLVVLFADGFEG